MSRTDRLRQQIDDLHQQWQMLSEKLGLLQKQKILETRVEETMRLQHLIDETQAERQRVERELDKLETQSEAPAEHEQPSNRRETTMQQPLKVFFCYARQDKELRDQLETHLSLLKHQGLIAGWHDRCIEPGQEWWQEIDRHLEAAQIILLLVSPDFMASRYCYEIEMKRALEKHGAGEARVIPIILRPADWENAPFAKLQGLPGNGTPITKWPDRDEAFLDVVQGIRRVVESSRAGPGKSAAAEGASEPPSASTTAPQSAKTVIKGDINVSKGDVVFGNQYNVNLPGKKSDE